MGKTYEGDQIHKRYPIYAAHTKDLQPECHQAVGWCVICRVTIIQGAHTVSMMFMVSGSKMERSRKHKINGGSSTEAKIVVSENALP